MEKSRKKLTDRKKISETVSSRIKDSDLVRKKHLLIAKKAAKLFIKKGYPQTTMREISKATGMAIGNLYDYITKKEDVLCLVFEVFHRHVQETINRNEIMKEPDPRKQLKLFIHASISNVQEFRNEIVLMYRESRLLPKKNLKRAMQIEFTQIRELEKIIRRGIKEGVLPAQDPYFAASMIFFQLVVPALRGWTFQEKYSDAKLNGMIETFILKGVIS